MNDTTVVTTQALWESADLYTGNPLEPDMETPTPAVIVASLTGPQREQRVRFLMDQAHEIYRLGVEEHRGSREIVGSCILYSGGNDSTVLAHLFKDVATHAIHANTTIGVEQSREFVRATCKHWGIELLEETAPTSYRDLVLERGFPGPAMHYKMYQRLKERGLMQARGKLVKNGHKERVVFIAGRRRQESKRREGIPLHERRTSVIWVSPLAMWTKLDMNTYRLMMKDVPVNEVSNLIHMSGECLCLAPETMISTPDGWKQIVDIREGDDVYSLQSGAKKASPVVKVYHNGIKPVLDLKTTFMPNIRITDNHPVYVRDFKYALHGGPNTIGKPRWATADELKASYEANQRVSASQKRMHYVGYPFRTEESSLGLSDEALRLLGYFVAEGAFQYRKDKYRDGIAGIVFTVSARDRSRKMAEDIAHCIGVVVGRKAGWREYTDKRTGRDFIMVRASSAAASDFIQKYTHGRYCWEKTLSEEVLSATLREQRIIIDAMWQGDGSMFSRERIGRPVEHVSAYSTTSRGLALQTQEILLRLGEVFGVNSMSTPKTASADRGRQAYLVRRSGTTKRGFIQDGILWASVASVKAGGVSDTYNLMIGAEPNYITEGGLVHNCGAFAKPNELEEIGLWFPEVKAEIEALQVEVRAAGHEEPFCTWGHGQGKASKSGMLCSSCEVPGQFDMFTNEVSV